jgi:hypothetical protein
MAAVDEINLGPLPKGLYSLSIEEDDHSLNSVAGIDVSHISHYGLYVGVTDSEGKVIIFLRDLIRFKKIEFDSNNNPMPFISKTALSENFGKKFCFLLNPYGFLYCCEIILRRDYFRVTAPFLVELGVPVFNIYSSSGLCFIETTDNRLFFQGEIHNQYTTRGKNDFSSIKEVEIGKINKVHEGNWLVVEDENGDLLTFIPEEKFNGMCSLKKIESPPFANFELGSVHHFKTDEYLDFLLLSGIVYRRYNTGSWKAIRSSYVSMLVYNGCWINCLGVMIIDQRPEKQTCVLVGPNVTSAVRVVDRIIFNQT